MSTISSRGAVATIASSRALADVPPPEAHYRGLHRLTVKAPALFQGNDSHLRTLVARAFQVPEVRSVVLLHGDGTVRIRLNGTLDPTRAWRRLGELIRAGGGEPSRDVDVLKPLELRALDHGLPVRISRIGDGLTTFRVRALGEAQLHLAHPLLRRRDVHYRVRELLISIHGVSRVRGTRFTTGLVVDYDPTVVEAVQIVRQLDLSWPRLVAGFAPPAVPLKLAAAGGLLTLATAAQFFNPVLLPWATAAALLYSAPNLIAAARELSRGRVGLPTLYAASFGLLLWTRLPFASSLMATFSQTWPALARRLAVDAERRLFAEHRRRATWARLLGKGGDEATVHVDQLSAGDLIVARTGDLLPADGIVAEGSALVDEHTVLGSRLIRSRAGGDRVYAGGHILDGSVLVRVDRTGDRTALNRIAGQLPHGAIAQLPSSREAERIANRNAKPALVLAAAALLVTRTPRLSQVSIRPDYATAPRLSAHLSALAGQAESLSHGVLLRDPAVLDRLHGADLYVFDESLDFQARAVTVLAVQAADRIRAREALGLALAAFRDSADPREAALERVARKRSIALPLVSARRRLADAVRFHDEAGGLVTVRLSEHVRQGGLVGSDGSAIDRTDDVTGSDSPSSIVVLRGRDVVGTVSFARHGATSVAAAVASLRSYAPQARFVHLSGQPQDVAERRAGDAGFDAVFGELDPLQKAETIRSLGGRVIWIGNGADARTTPSRLASHVSVSTAGVEALDDEQADVALLQGEPLSLLAALHAADRHSARLSADYRKVYLANIAGLAGGFIAGFGSLQVGLLSNGGTATVLLSRWRALRDLSSRNGRVRAAQAFGTGLPFRSPAPTDRGPTGPHPRSSRAAIVAAPA